MNKKIKLCLFVFIFIGVLVLNITYKNKDEVTKRQEHSNLAIMVKGETGEYVSSNEIPKGNYVLNEEKTVCENGGKVVSYNYSTGQIGFSFLGSDRCSLYFDYKDNSIEITSLMTVNNVDIFEENGIRFEGTDPNNYICLDNQESGSCSDSSLLFRIIGLFDEDTSSDGTTSAGTKKLLKVIDTNNYGGTAGKKWDTNNSKDWKSASLAIDLNENYYNSLIGLSDINSKLLDNITMAKWRLGTYADDSVRNYSIYELFSMEHNENSEYVYEKVGLMYPSDYGYSSVGGTTTNKSDCLNVGLMNWKSYNDCYSNSWLYNSAIFVNKAEWFLTPGTINYSGYLGQYDNGYVYTLNYFFLSTGLLAVRPTLYLDAETLKIVGGTGSQTDPYHIG